MLPGKSRTLFGVTPSSFRPQPSICFGTVGIDRVTIQISSRDLTRRRLAFPIPTMTLRDHGSPSHSPLALWRETGGKRKSGVWGKGGAGRVVYGGGRQLKKKKDRQ